MNERVDPQARRALADDAKAWLETPAFLKAMADLKRRWQDEWVMQEDPRKRDELWARFRALDAIPSQLVSYLTDERVAQMRKR